MNSARLPLPPTNDYGMHSSYSLAIGNSRGVHWRSRYVLATAF